MAKFRLRISLLFLILLSTQGFSEEIIDTGKSSLKLSSENATWSKVIPGKVICEPKITENGFAAITDAKTLISFTSNGKIIFEKNVDRNTRPELTVLPHDFFVITNKTKKQISLHNPSGLKLWETVLDSEILTSAFAGRDGRFFTLTKKSLYCFGITGICKWVVSVPLPDSEEQTRYRLQELPDGSLILINSKKITRISPFGTILEEINFTAKIADAKTTKAGVLLNFNNNELQLLTVDGNEKNCSFDWKITEQIIAMDISPDKNKIFLLTYGDTNKSSEKLTFRFIEADTGRLLFQYQVKNLNKPKYVIWKDDGIFLSDSANAAFFSESGKILWDAKLPPASGKTGFDYLLLTNDSHLVLFQKNWNLDAFRLMQKTSNSKKTQVSKKTGIQKSKEQISYKSFLSLENSQFLTLYTHNLDNTITDPKMVQFLKQGLYGAEEAQILSKLYSATQSYYEILNTSNFGTRIEDSVFKTDTKGMAQILQLLCLFGTDTFNEHTAMFLKREKDISNIVAILQGLTINGYDPDGKILTSLAQLASKTGSGNSATDKALARLICDSTFSICRFMGDSVFPEAKEILTGFMYPNYPAETRTYARECLTKIADL